MEVIINGQLAELGNSFPTITRKSVDINNPSVRFIDFTNKFQLPDTLNNREIFESPKIIGSDNRSYDKLYDVVIRDVFQIFRGKGFLDSGTKNNYSFQVIDNATDLFKALDTKLNSISWDDLDTDLSQTSIDEFDSVDIDNCWFWGKACYHNQALKINTDQTTGDARCKYSRPAFYIQGLLNRAIIQAGYTMTSPEPDLAFSACHSEFYLTSYQKTLDDDYIAGAIGDLDTNDFEHSDLTVTGTTINIGTKKTMFRLRGTMTSDAVTSIIVRATDNVDGTKISESKLNIGIGTQAVDFTTSEFFSADGNTIDIRIEGAANVTILALFYSLLSDKTEDLSTNPWLNYRIKVHDNLPDLTYLDLYRTICVVSNQYHIVDNYVKMFSFGSLANLSKLNTVDWSDKFIIGSEQVTAQFSGLFKKNWLKYENDITVNPELGWSYFLTDNESLEAEGDYIVLKFGASVDVKIDSNDIAYASIYDDTTRIADQEVKIRLFAISGSRLIFTPVSWYQISDNYYSEWFESLSRIRAITAEFNLSKLDVLKWHERQLVYVDYFKTTFIVLEISNFIPGRLTKVKLLAYGR